MRDILLTVPVGVGGNLTASFSRMLSGEDHGLGWHRMVPWTAAGVRPSAGSGKKSHVKSH